jgi:hypothetical protein
VTKPLALNQPELPLSEKQIPQVVEIIESGSKLKEALEAVAVRPRQVGYQAALRPDICALLILNYFLDFRYRPACPNRPTYNRM